MPASSTKVATTASREPGDWRAWRCNELDRRGGRQYMPLISLPGLDFVSLVAFESSLAGLPSSLMSGSQASTSLYVGGNSSAFLCAILVFTETVSPEPSVVIGSLARSRLSA